MSTPIYDPSCVPRSREEEQRDRDYNISYLNKRIREVQRSRQSRLPSSYEQYTRHVTLEDSLKGIEETLASCDNEDDRDEICEIIGWPREKHRRRVSFADKVEVATIEDMDSSEEGYDRGHGGGGHDSDSDSDSDSSASFYSCSEDTELSSVSSTTTHAEDPRSVPWSNSRNSRSRRYSSHSSSNRERPSSRQHRVPRCTALKEKLELAKQEYERELEREHDRVRESEAHYQRLQQLQRSQSGIMKKAEKRCFLWEDCGVMVRSDGTTVVPVSDDPSIPGLRGGNEQPRRREQQYVDPPRSILKRIQSVQRQYYQQPQGVQQGAYSYPPQSNLQRSQSVQRQYYQQPPQEQEWVQPPQASSKLQRSQFVPRQHYQQPQPEQQWAHSPHPGSNLHCSQSVQLQPSQHQQYAPQTAQFPAHPPQQPTLFNPQQAYYIYPVPQNGPPPPPPPPPHRYLPPVPSSRPPPPRELPKRQYTLTYEVDTSPTHIPQTHTELQTPTKDLYNAVYATLTTNGVNPDNIKVDKADGHWSGVNLEVIVAVGEEIYMEAFATGKLSKEDNDRVIGRFAGMAGTKREKIAAAWFVKALFDAVL
ncbi:hypothetical protein EJ08DRAFT_694693 [Tothia fuscella]|uniref:Uncharacterized protein n=1 Tax=Tothia fuscella TaxID=1048955 RepID=A0A9P4NW57_9PEZI|nr:hypothetical protein EJ08DRAFT_694693 [Tothia fuscella]